MRKNVTLLLIICMLMSCNGIVYAEESSPIPTNLEHNWSEWEITKEPTYFDEGEQTRHCLDEACDETETAPVEKLKAYGKWIKVDNNKYYFDANSNPVTGWKKIKSSNSKLSIVK